MVHSSESQVTCKYRRQRLMAESRLGEAPCWMASYMRHLSPGLRGVGMGMSGRLMVQWESRRKFRMVWIHGPGT